MIQVKTDNKILNWGKQEVEERPRAEETPGLFNSRRCKSPWPGGEEKQYPWMLSLTAAQGTHEEKEASRNSKEKEKTDDEKKKKNRKKKK